MTVAGRVVLATSTAGLERDADLPQALAALRARGVDASAVRWDEPGFDWAGCGDVVIRSTWDYGPRLEEYLAWADRVASTGRLHNPIEVVRWNCDKRYLRELAEAGVPAVPTTFLEPGDKAVLPGYEQFVVKPTVSAGAKDTARYTADQAESAVAHVEALHRAGRAVMVQPYLARIAEGERALVLLGGSFSHAMRKGPVLTDIGVIDNARVAHPDLVTHQPSAAELAVAGAAVAVAPRAADILIARVDLALTDDGSPVVMELELIEPNLFLRGDQERLERFAGAVQRWTAPTSR